MFWFSCGDKCILKFIMIANRWRKGRAWWKHITTQKPAQSAVSIGKRVQVQKLKYQPRHTLKNIYQITTFLCLYKQWIESVQEHANIFMHIFGLTIIINFPPNWVTLGLIQYTPGFVLFLGIFFKIISFAFLSIDSSSNPWFDAPLFDIKYE